MPVALFDPAITPETACLFALEACSLPLTQVRPCHAGAQRWTFFSPDAIVHVARPGREHVLTQESSVLAALSNRSPQVMATGQQGRYSWQVQSVLPGLPLNVVWPRLSLRQQQDALARSADVLRRIHASSIPEGIRANPTWSFGGLEGFLERLTICTDADLVPLPLQKAIQAWVSHRPHLTMEHAASARVLCHGDFQPSNLLWDDGEVHVVDFELALQEERDFELLTLLPGFAGLASVAECSPLEVLQGEYPELWSHPHREDRLVLLRLLRRLILLQDRPDRIFARFQAPTILFEMMELLTGATAETGSLPLSPLPAR